MLCSNRSISKKFVLLAFISFVMASNSALAASDYYINSTSDGYTIGPILSGTEHQLLQSRLNKNDVDYQSTQIALRESLGFIVVTEPFRNKAKAAPVQTRLKDAGIADYLYIQVGDYINRISVGVFSKRPSADARARSINITLPVRSDHSHGQKRCYPCEHHRSESP